MIFIIGHHIIVIKEDTLYPFKVVIDSIISVLKSSNCSFITFAFIAINGRQIANIPIEKLIPNI